LEEFEVVIALVEVIVEVEIVPGRDVVDVVAAVVNVTQTRQSRNLNVMLINFVRTGRRFCCYVGRRGGFGVSILDEIGWCITV
jgi:hypothetical protein